MFIEPEEPVEPMQRISNLSMEGLRGAPATVAPPGPDGRPNIVPTVGDIWHDPTDNTTYVYYEDFDSHAWLPIGGSAK